MSGISISIADSELRKLQDDLKRYYRKKENQIWDAVNDSLLNIKTGAERNLSSAIISLKNSGSGAGLLGAIFMKPNRSKLEGSVIADKLYAPYLEYGTGKNVFKSSYNFPQEARQYAAQFKRGGKRNPNLHARAFITPVFYEEGENFKNKIKKILGKV